MKAILYLCMLVWCLYGVPWERWAVMTDVQQDELLDGLADSTMEELHCEEVEMSVYPEGKWVFIYGECIEGKYVALNERRNGR